MVKYPLWVQNYYIIRYNMTVASILTFDKCLYIRGRLQLTIARRLSAYVSLTALATTTASSSICIYLLCSYCLVLILCNKLILIGMMMMMMV